MTPIEHALYYAARGWRVVPIPTGHKHPHGIDEWQLKATTDAARLERYWGLNPDHGVGIATGVASGLVAIDIDAYKPGASEAWDDLVAAHGGVPDTIEQITGGGGRHLLFAHPDDDGPPISNASHAMPYGVDVRGEGGFIVAAPTVHPDTGQRYVWEVEHDPFDGLVPAPMPAWLVTLLRTPLPAQVARAERKPYVGGDSIVDRFAADHTWPELLEARGWTFHSARLGHELWTRPGKEVRAGASASLYYGGSDVLKVFTSSAAPLEQLRTYSRFGLWAAYEHAGDHTAAASAYRRQINAEGKGAVVTEPKQASTVDATTEEAAPVGQQPHSDLGNARRLVTEHGHDLRHAPQIGAWLAWDGHRWAEDVTGEVIRRGKAVVDGMVTQLATTIDSELRKKLAAHWMRSQAAARLEAMVQLARTEPGVPVLVRELDADPWIINTAAGVVDLRSGEVSSPDRRALVTKLAPVAHDPAATCSRWEDFVTWAMRGDAELTSFVQRAVGYSLTGLVSEQCLFFLHGGGENGKSTFLNVLGRLMGDYAIAAEPDLLLATSHEKHSTGVADLIGRRLVVVQETEEGRRFAEATVKQLTGGDTIRARRMRQDFFEFHPTHKLWMAANHRPQVRGTDHAIWRRIRMIPFEARLAPGQKDEHLLEALVGELPGIFNWALAGCAGWRQDGLQPPAAVLQATSEYRTEQDHVGRFLEDCCELAEGLTVTASDLRAAYEAWCRDNGENAWSARAMAPHLVDRGCALERTRSSRLWRHIALHGPAQEELQRRLDRGDWGRRAAGDSNDRDDSNAPLDAERELEGAPF